MGWCGLGLLWSQEPVVCTPHCLAPQERCYPEGITRELFLGATRCWKGCSSKSVNNYMQRAPVCCSRGSDQQGDVWVSQSDHQPHVVTSPGGDLTGSDWIEYLMTLCPCLFLMEKRRSTWVCVFWNSHWILVPVKQVDALRALKLNHREGDMIAQRNVRSFVQHLHFHSAAPEPCGWTNFGAVFGQTLPAYTCPADQALTCCSIWGLML